MTCIKRQIGGGKATNSTRAEDSDDDELSSLSPSPALLTLCPRSQKATSESEGRIVEGRDSSLRRGVPKSAHGCKRVEVVLTTATRKARKRAPSIIVVRDSSRSEEMNVGGKCKVLGDPELLISEDEQDTSIRKRKAKSLESSCPTKRVASLLDMNTMQCSTLKPVKASLQARSIKNKRLRIISPPSCESFNRGAQSCRCRFHFRCGSRGCHIRS